MIQSTSINSIKHTDEGLYISTKVRHLPTGEYAFVPSKTGITEVLEFTKSHGTDFYKRLCTIDISYDFIKSSGLSQPHTVELNACPSTSATMEYAKDALLFNI